MLYFHCSSDLHDFRYLFWAEKVEKHVLHEVVQVLLIAPTASDFYIKGISYLCVLTVWFSPSSFIISVRTYFSFSFFFFGFFFFLLHGRFELTHSHTCTRPLSAELQPRMLEHISVYRCVLASCYICVSVHITHVKRSHFSSFSFTFCSTVSHWIVFSLWL